MEESFLKYGEIELTGTLYRTPLSDGRILLKVYELLTEDYQVH